MTIKRDVELIEDGRRYKQALLDIAKLIDGPKKYRSSQIMEIIAEAKAAFGEHVSPWGPWPVLTDHIALCKDCKPTNNVPRGIYILGILMCKKGCKLMQKFYDHQGTIRSKVEMEALK